MSESSTEEFRVRVDRKLIEAARRVAEEIGTSPGELVRLLFTQLVKRRAVPFPLQADSLEEEVLGSPERRAKMLDYLDEGKPAAR
jgi:antitoxin component of RelBE/YafQ-DinJ toxin-antitoxin module